MPIFLNILITLELFFAEPFTLLTSFQCDMTGGGYNVVNLRRQVDVGGRHRYRSSVFNVGHFGASSNSFRFGKVVADFHFAGELDDSK